MSSTVIKFHYVHVLSKTVSSQMQHLQHNFKVNYWFNIKLCEDIRISKQISYKTNLQQSLPFVRPRVLKSPQSRSLDVCN